MKRNRQLKYQTFETCFEQECMDHKECPKVKTYIKKQKKKKIHSGRPPLNNQQSPNNVVEIKDIQYISESPILGKIMELILTSAQYKPIQKVGKKCEDESNLKLDADIQVENKELNKKLSKYMIEKKIENFNTVYFLRREKRTLKFENDQLKDSTKYHEFNDKNFKEVEKFIKLINLIFKELSVDFIKIFDEIVEFYLREKQFTHKSLKLITTELLKHINSEQENMKYLFQWNELKKITQNTKYKLKQIEEYQEPEQLININEIGSKQEQIKVTTPEPIEQFISQLLKYFEELFQELYGKQQDQLYNEFEQENQFKIELEQEQTESQNQLFQVQERNLDFKNDQQLAMIQKLGQFIKDFDSDLIKQLEQMAILYIKQKVSNIDFDTILKRLENFFNTDSQILCLSKWEVLKEQTSSKNLNQNLVHFFEKIYNEMEVETI